LHSDSMKFGVEASVDLSTPHFPYSVQYFAVNLFMKLLSVAVHANHLKFTVANQLGARTLKCTVWNGQYTIHAFADCCTDRFFWATRFYPRGSSDAWVLAVIVFRSVCHTPVLYQNGWTYYHADNATW